MCNRARNFLVQLVLLGMQFAIVRGLRFNRCAAVKPVVGRALMSSASLPAVAYPVVFHERLCGAPCVALQCPNTPDFIFKPLDPLTIAHLECLNGLTTSSDYEVINTELALGEEKELGKAARVNVFMGGRLALRRAIRETGLIDGTSTTVEAIEPLLTTAHGGPAMPHGYTGSISHKDSIAVAAAMHVGEGSNHRGHIGVDIEKCANAAHEKLMRRLLTSNEQTDIMNPSRITHTGLSPQEDVMLRFSFKEAVYKAVHPYLLRYVEFTEVEVYPEAGGSATIQFRLRTGERYDYQAEWRRFNERYWITCVNIWSGPKRADDAEEVTPTP